MKVIVTCGPSYEPVDEVRRITNFSTGELGVLLSTAFAGAGFETICLRGVAATHAATPAGATVRPFTTNDDLAEQLRALGESGMWRESFTRRRFVTTACSGSTMRTATKSAEQRSPAEAAL